MPAGGRYWGYAWPWGWGVWLTDWCAGIWGGGFPAPFMHSPDGAWAANPVILCLLPLGAAVAAALARQYVKTGSRRLAGWPLAATWLMVAILVGFGVIRNLPR